MSRTTDITSFTEHRQNLREHLRQVRETGRPLYITTNGRPDAVVLSPEAYDDLANRAELAEGMPMPDDSTEDIREGCAQAQEPVGALEKSEEELGSKRRQRSC